MSIVKRVLGHIYFGYAMLLFVSTMLIVLLPVLSLGLVSEDKQPRYLHRIFRAWMGVFMPLAGCPVRRRGAHFFKKGENYVVVCNHNSFADVPVTSPWIPGPNKTLAKSELARIPLFGIIYKSGAVLVDRKSEGSRRESYSRMASALDAGLHLCLYPEGTRNKGGQPMQAFYDGAFITAVRSQKPVMPGVIFHTRGIFPGRPKAWAWPHPIDFHFLPPVPTAGLKTADVSALKDEVRDRMMAYFVAGPKQHKAS